MKEREKSLQAPRIEWWLGTLAGIGSCRGSNAKPDALELGELRPATLSGYSTYKIRIIVVPPHRIVMRTH